MSQESRVNVYGRALQKVLKSGRGPWLFDIDGNKYFDLFSSAGVSNFGHNHPQLKAKLIDYLSSDGLVHGLDYFTQSKQRFIRLMEETILPPLAKGRYRYYFSPPAGTLAIEAAIKYARKASGRRELACFSNGFHGLTYNALSITGNVAKRKAAYCDLANVARLPYDGYLGAEVDYTALYRRLLLDPSGGYDKPAALVFECVQAEGGCYTGTQSWYSGVIALCRELGIVTIADEIQAGCGRTGDYFSFSRFAQDAWPDIICLSKSLSGLGLPLSLVMVKHDLDQLESGENSGTFRGSCLGVESAANTLELFHDREFQATVTSNQSILEDFVRAVIHGLGLEVRGRGLLRGVVFPTADQGNRVVAALRESGILAETCGGAQNTLKIMPPLSTPPAELAEILERTSRVIHGVKA